MPYPTINQVTTQAQHYAEVAYNQTTTALSATKNKVQHYAKVAYCKASPVLLSLIDKVQQFYQSHRREIIIASGIVTGFVAPKAFLAGVAIGYTWEYLANNKQVKAQQYNPAYRTSNAVLASVCTALKITTKISPVTLPLTVGMVIGSVIYYSDDKSKAKA